MHQMSLARALQMHEHARRRRRIEPLNYTRKAWRETTRSEKVLYSTVPESGQVCTAEAVVGALLHMGLDEFEGDKVINLATKKVDLVKRYRGKV